MDKKAGTGELSCKVCGQQFQTGINCKSSISTYPILGSPTASESEAHYRLPDLSAAVDVYSDWIDACDTVAKEAADASRTDAPQSYSDLAAGAGGRRNSDMQIDCHLVAAVDDEEDGQGDYDDE